MSEEEISGRWEPPTYDRKRGVVYFSCPEWMDCGECSVDCVFNPHSNPADFVDYSDVEVPDALFQVLGEGG